MKAIKKGVYKHYKGGQYRILNEALNTETKEPLVVYQDMSDETKVWARPQKMFLDEVEIAGEKKPRFKFVCEDEDDSAENKYLRALADYQNLLRQSAKEKAEFVKYAVTDFLHSILPVYDHLKLALKGLSDEERKSPWVEGVSHVLKQFKEVLAQQGIEEIKTSGEKFNHDLMEAIAGSGEKVKQEIIPGYKLNGKVIRPAKVIVE